MIQSAAVQNAEPSADSLIALHEFNSRHPGLSECLVEFVTNHGKLNSLGIYKFFSLLEASYMDDFEVMPVMTLIVP